MRIKNQERLAVFESADVKRLIGIPLITLNKIIERRLYGIAPSVRTGKGRGRRRLFSLEDVFGIALVWWLFEAGLRSTAIQSALNDICLARRGVTANKAASKMLKLKADILLIERKPKTAAYLLKSPRTMGGLHVLREALLAANATSMLVPVGTLFATLEQAMERMEE